MLTKHFLLDWIYHSFLICVNVTPLYRKNKFVLWLLINPAYTAGSPKKHGTYFPLSYSFTKKNEKLHTEVKRQE